MIRKLIIALLLIALGGGLTYYGLGHHFVKTDDGTIVVAKAQLTLKDTYVGIRKWQPSDFREHAEVVKALVDQGHGDVVAKHAARDVLDAAKEKLKDILR